MSAAFGALRGLVSGNSMSYDSYMSRISQMSTNELIEEHRDLLRNNSFKSFSMDDLMRALDTLDPRTETIPFVTLIQVKLLKDVASRSKAENAGNTLRSVVDRISTIDVNEALLFLDYYFKVIEMALSVAKILREERQVLALTFVRNALAVLDKEERTITKMHSSFFDACLLAGRPDLALEVIYEDVREVLLDPATNTNKAKELFFYYSHAAEVQYALGNYRQAAHLYLNALMVPVASLCNLHLLVYKRFVLLNFVLGNPFSQLPHCLHELLERLVRPKCEVFDELIRIASKKAYKRNIVTILDEFIRRNAFMLNGDNMGPLILKVRERVKHEVFMKVATTFKVIQMDDVRKRCFLGSDEEVLKVMEELVAEGRIEAEYNRETGFLKFAIPPPRKVDPEDLVKAQKTLAQLKEAVGFYDEQCRRNKAYVSHTKKDKKEHMMPAGF
uniref:COP9 signalosome complex subunit 3 n=1 Tax=Steinernema glaseri TaxID=37863 RepID=A0A1I8AN05_9BILA